MAKKIHSYVLALVLFAFAAGGCSPEEPSRQIISETLLADFADAQPIPQTFSVSWDSRHVGYAIKVGNKQCLVVDGKQGKHYDTILPVPPSCTTNGYAPIFSPDSKRVGYVVRTGDKEFVVVDGKAGKTHVEIFSNPFSPNIIFSPDGKRVAYIVFTGNTMYVVVGGKAEKQYESIQYNHPLFSSDSKHYAYVAGKANEEFVVIDGREAGKYAYVKRDSFLFSRDGKRHLFVADNLDYAAEDLLLKNAHEPGVDDEDYVDAKEFVVVDGKPQKQYHGIGKALFSPDGRRVAYAARVGKKWFVVLDGKEGKKYDRVGNIVFSQDSKRMAYAAAEGKNRFVVTDGKEGKKHDPIEPTYTVDDTLFPQSKRTAYCSVNDVIFSPDSKRIAYTVGPVDGSFFEEKPRSFVVVDGKKHKEYDGVRDLTFSPDSKRFAYVANIEERGFFFDFVEDDSENKDSANKGDSTEADGEEDIDTGDFVVVDGEEGKKYDSIDRPVFSPDGKHVAYIAEGYFIVVDGTEKKRYEVIIESRYHYWENSEFLITGGLIFDSAKTFHYLAEKNNRIFLVEEKIR